MGDRGQSQHYCPSTKGSCLPGNAQKKTAPLLDEWERIWEDVAQEVSSTPSCIQRYREHQLAQLVCPGRHTLTSLISTNGKQYLDWTADYALYAQERVRPEVIFNYIRCEAETLKPANQPLCVALDDTILRKRGRLIPGAAYRKDPLGPPFNLNLVWAQRMQQISVAIPGPSGDVRMVPIAFHDASTPRKPSKKACPEEVAVYKEKMKQRNLNMLAVNAIAHLQKQRHMDQAHPADLHVLVDGSYTNRKVMRKLPVGTVLIGRMRKDARLHSKPESQAASGRKRIYGEALPTPEQIRKDENIPWQEIDVTAGGKVHTLRVKTIDPLRWRVAGNTDLRLVVIAPAGYMLKKGAKRLYTQPAYLICTDTNLPLAQIVQEYVWRWDIEVNFHDEKSILGVGQAQVRNIHSAQSIPASAVASFSMLHLAAIRAYGWNAIPGVIPPAKWRNQEDKYRASTLELLNELRRELWAEAIRAPHLTDFVNAGQRSMKPSKPGPNIASCLFAFSS